MADKADEKAAKENRLRVFRQEGAQALEDAANEAAIRKNMARLKELRLAKEAATIREQIAAGNDPKAKPKKRSR